VFRRFDVFSARLRLGWFVVSLTRYGCMRCSVERVSSWW
jgi:hypothetical protein